MYGSRVKGPVTLPSTEGKVAHRQTDQVEKKKKINVAYYCGICEVSRCKNCLKTVCKLMKQQKAKQEPGHCNQSAKLGV